MPMAPTPYMLVKGFPNPFNPSITIHVELPEAGPTSITIYNMAGQQIRKLESGFMAAGPHDFTWDGRDDDGVEVSSGVYIAETVSGDMLATYRMSLIK